MTDLFGIIVGHFLRDALLDVGHFLFIEGELLLQIEDILIELVVGYLNLAGEILNLCDFVLKCSCLLGKLFFFSLKQGQRPF